MWVNFAQGIKDIFNTELMKHAELTAIEKQIEFQDKYTQISRILEKSSHVGENKIGKMDVFIGNIPLEEQNYLSKAGVILDDERHYMSTMENFWKNETYNLGQSTNNPYAKRMIYQSLQKALPIQNISWHKHKDELLEKAGINKIYHLVKNISNINTIENYIENSSNIIGTINNSYISATSKMDMMNEIPHRLADDMLLKLSLENPQKLLDLYEKNKTHPIITDSTPRILMHQIHASKRNLEAHSRISTKVLEVDLANNIEILKNHGLVNEEYFQKLLNIYQSTGNEASYNSVISKINYAEKYYKVSQKFQTIPLEEREAYLQNQASNLQSKDYATEVKIYNEIKNEYLANKHLYEVNPAEAASKSLLEISNPIARLEGASIYEKRYLDQISKNVPNPRILTNMERDNLVFTLKNAESSNDLQNILNLTENKYGELYHKVLQEVKSSPDINDDVFLKQSLHYAFNGEAGKMEEILNLRNKKNSGVLKDNTFVDKQSLIVIKELINTDRKLFSSLSDSDYAESKQFLYEVAKDVFKRSNEEMSAENVLLEAKKLYFNHLHTDNEIYVPKSYPTIKGATEITTKEAQSINNYLKKHLQNNLYWTEEHLSSIFGKIYAPSSPYIKENQLNLMRESVRQGRWILNRDNSGYILEMSIGNKTFYDIDKQKNLKIWTLEEITQNMLSVIPKEEEHIANIKSSTPFFELRY